MKSFIDNAMSRTVSVLLFILLASCTSIPEGIKPVTDFNSDNYLGTWYEVARFDHSFERGLENVTATYTRRADGGIDVLNRGFNQTLDEWDEANGKAYFVGEQTEGHLKVSFFGPFYASYIVMAVDKEAYQYSLVTGPSRDYLWILARRPKIDQGELNKLLHFAEQQGFNTSELIWVKHSSR